VSIYDPATNKWMSKAPMPFDEWVAASGRVINGKFYVVGGYEDLYNGVMSHLYVYDPAAESWVEKAHMPTARGLHSAAAANGVLYAIGGLGGQFGTSVLATNQAYFP
jgi:N-acetylneuraminic acid mutarotase